MANVPWHEGDVVRKLRAIVGWKLEDLQERTGVNVSVINRLELGITKEAKRETLKKLAKPFGWTAQQLSNAVPSLGVNLSQEMIDAERLARETQKAVKRAEKKDREMRKRRTKAVR